MGQKGNPIRSHKKKLTKKEQKALNHAKLMSSKGHPENVIDLENYRKEKKKKAA